MTQLGSRTEKQSGVPKALKVVKWLWRAPILVLKGIKWFLLETYWRQWLPPTDDLVASLKRIGVQFELITKGRYSRYKGGVKLTGENIDEVWPRRVVTESATADYLIYVIRLPTLRQSIELKAETEEVKTGQPRDDVSNIKWIGGELAYRLNEDTELAKLLASTGLQGIKVRPKTWLGRRVEILGYPVVFPAPSREALQVYNAIAKHVREVESTTGLVGHVSRRERRLVQGSIKRRIIDNAKFGGALGFAWGLFFVFMDDITIGEGIFGVVSFILMGAAVASFFTLLWLGIQRLRGRF